MPFEFIRAVIPDVVVIRPRLIRDGRGFFMFINGPTLPPTGSGNLRAEQSFRSVAGILRRLHYQKHPRPEKLVRPVLAGIRRRR
jgi:dTDP-4-dehydrorhamnose 3,5-epimerase-like enzyme